MSCHSEEHEFHLESECSNSDYHFHTASYSQPTDSPFRDDLRRKLTSLSDEANDQFMNAVSNAKQTVRDLESALETAQTIQELYDPINIVYKAQIQVSQVNRLVSRVRSEIDSIYSVWNSYYSPELQVLRIEADYRSNLARLKYRVESTFQKNLHIRNTLTNIYHSRLANKLADILESRPVDAVPLRDAIVHDDFPDPSDDNVHDRYLCCGTLDHPDCTDEDSPTLNHLDPCTPSDVAEKDPIDAFLTDYSELYQAKSSSRDVPQDLEADTRLQQVVEPVPVEENSESGERPTPDAPSTV